MKNKNNNTLVMIVVAVVVGALGFYGGMMYQKSQVSSNAQFAGGGAGGAGGRFRQGGVGGFSGANAPVRGQIVSQDANSITVKLQDGSSKIVDISDKTTINKATQGSKADLTSGQTVTVFGSKNSDGSVNAQIVSLGTGVGMMRGAGGQPGQQNQAPKQQ
jgi:cytochrome c biogenesis protein ResB